MRITSWRPASTSCEVRSAVDVDDGAGQETIGEREQNRIRKIVGLANPARREPAGGAGKHRLALFRFHPCVGVRFGHARRYDINSPWRKFDGKHTCASAAIAALTAASPEVPGKAARPAATVTIAMAPSDGSLGTSACVTLQ